MFCFVFLITQKLIPVNINEFTVLPKLLLLYYQFLAEHTIIIVLLMVTVLLNPTLALLGGVYYFAFLLCTKYSRSIETSNLISGGMLPSDPWTGNKQSQFEEIYLGLVWVV